MRRTKEIELFGRKVTLSERDAGDVLGLVEFSNQHEHDDTFNVIVTILILESGLKGNLKPVPEVKYPFFQRRKAKERESILAWNRLFSYDNLMTLSPAETSELAVEVLRLDGMQTEGEGKKAEPQLAVA